MAAVGYLEHDGMAFYGYSLRKYDGYGYNDDYVYFSNSVVKRVNNIISKHTTKIPKGTNLYLAPNCPHAVNDVRRNYKLKRGFDNGDYNVLPLIGEYSYKNCCVSIFPVKNVIYISSWDQPNEDQMLARAQKDFPDLKKSDMIHIDDYQVSFTYVDNEDSYVKILLGENKKPVVTYDVLDLDTDNELNYDILYLVYMTANLKPTYENYTKFRTELFTLNNYNWRRYPGTISLLNDMMVFGEGESLKYNLSGEPKPVKEILKTRNKAFSGDKDKRLAQEFLIRIMNLQNVRFVDALKLSDKISELAVPTETFTSLFTTVTKITPNNFNEEKNQD